MCYQRICCLTPNNSLTQIALKTYVCNKAFGRYECDFGYQILTIDGNEENLALSNLAFVPIAKVKEFRDSPMEVKKAKRQYYLLQRAIKVSRGSKPYNYIPVPDDYQKMKECVTSAEEETVSAREALDNHERCIQAKVEKIRAEAEEKIRRLCQGDTSKLQNRLKEAEEWESKVKQLEQSYHKRFEKTMREVDKWITQ